MNSERIEELARAIPAEERPIPASRLSGFADFLGIYGGEHIAATEFVIGALLVGWGVKTTELIVGLIVGNILAASTYALVTAPIAVDTRLSLFAYLRKVAGPWFQRGYNAAWGIVSVIWGSSMLAISATSLREIFGFPVQLQWYPTSWGCVVITLIIVTVTVTVAQRGFKGVARFSGLCVPWMVAMFACGAIIARPILKASGTEVFSGVPAAGGVSLTWMHVAAFAWMCGFVYHAGLNDMAILRYAKKRVYGWVGLYGMFLGHFFAWLCAAAMGAAAAYLTKSSLTQLDPGAVAGTVLGWAGLLAVVIAGWTTANPNIYRATLSFATFFPKASWRKLVFGTGAAFAIAACFPAVMRIDVVANAAGLLLPSVGAICLVEHWLFPKIGFRRYYNLYRGRKLNPAALSAWLVSSVFAGVAVWFNWMHPFFLVIPVFILAGVVYLIFAALDGAKEMSVAARDGTSALLTEAEVDAVEARIAELANEEPVTEETRLSGNRGWSKIIAISSLAVMIVIAGVAPKSFKLTAVVFTLIYFCVTVCGTRIRKI